MHLGRLQHLRQQLHGTGRPELVVAQALHTTALASEAHHAKGCHATRARHSDARVRRPLAPGRTIYTHAIYTHGLTHGLDT
jgi:hypothetical protein